MEVRIQKTDSTLTTPFYAHDGDAGFDLRAAQDMSIGPGETAAVPTGLKLAIPQGHVGLVWDKSGNALKHSVHCMAGVVDSGYRGEVKVVMRNLSSATFEVKRDMKIAQMLIQPVVRARLVESDSLDDTARGEGGFGSTGRF